MRQTFKDTEQVIDEHYASDEHNISDKHETIENYDLEQQNVSGEIHHVDNDEQHIRDENRNSDEQSVDNEHRVSDERPVDVEHKLRNDLYKESQIFNEDHLIKEDEDASKKLSARTNDSDKGSPSPDQQTASTAPNYTLVDEHARKAPSALRNSVPELVEYLTQVSSDPKMIVRAIFVWISENIAYDCDGFFGKKKYLPCDAESVLRNGKSVCAGYANVVEMLCTKANVQVKKISGYAKEYGHSVDNPFTTVQDTDHAWNAVQLHGKWFLLDSTWGAGHVGTDRVFNKCFDEFYFLTDPKQLIYTHFPYMDNKMEASQRWQLLERPIDLDEFNKNVEIEPGGFKLGVTPVSHKQGLIRMKNEVTLSFKCDGKDEVEYLTSLEHKHGNELKTRNIFNQIENGLFTTRIHPHTTGTFKLTVFGKKATEDHDSFSCLIHYHIKCDSVDDAGLTFPVTYSAAQTNRCILIAPLRGNLQQNSEVEFHITSPYLSKIMINHNYFEKDGTIFKGNVKTGSKGTSLNVFGVRGSNGNFEALYTFQVV